MAQETQNFVYNSEKSPEFSRLVNELKGGKGRGKSTLSKDIQRALLLYHSLPENLREDFTDFELTLAYLQQSGFELINGASAEFLATHQVSYNQVHAQNTPVFDDEGIQVQNTPVKENEVEEFDREPKSEKDLKTIQKIKEKAQQGDEPSEKLVNKFFNSFDIGD